MASFVNAMCAALLMTALAIVPAVRAEPLRTRDLIDLWPGGVGPGSEQSPAKRTITERSKAAYFPDRSLIGVTRPNLTAFVPDHPNGTSVIVAPGGGYLAIALDRGSYEMARWLNPYGVTVFLLEYRLPGEGHANRQDIPLEDAQRAVRVVRRHAKEWGLDPNKVGFLGGSAGGNLAASVGTLFDKVAYQPTDDADRLSARPDFQILLYPVISMENGLTHVPTRTNLLGPSPSPEMIEACSLERHVTKSVPPTFIVVAEDDPVVLPENSIRYYTALKDAGVPAELHVFKEGGHGFGIRDARQLPVSNWPHLAVSWLRAGGFIQ